MLRIIPENKKNNIGFISDSTMLIISFFGSYFIKYQTFDGIIAKKQFLLFGAIAASWGLLLFFFKPYKEYYKQLELSYSVTKIFKILCLQLAFIGVFWMFTRDISYSRLRMFYYFTMALSLCSLYRYFIIRSLRYLNNKGLYTKNYMIIGKGVISKTIIDYYSLRPENGLHFKGYAEVEDYNDDQLAKEISRLKAQYNLQYIYCCSPYISSDKINSILKHTENENIELKVIMDYEGYFKKGLAIEYHDYIPVVSISQKPPVPNTEESLKRIFDVAFCMVVMTLGFPAFYLIGLITKLSSKGPIFYKSERIGHWGQKIYIYKFRSMYTNADEIAHQLLNGDMHSRGSEDPRITKWGHFMRKTRIDELPQFYNVLRGEMTVVGPRPLPEYDLEMIKAVSTTKYNLLISMKPGLTSLGQIKFGYAASIEDNIRRVNYDLLYLNRSSLKLDLWIILNTAKIMVQAKGR